MVVSVLCVDVSVCTTSTFQGIGYSYLHLYAQQPPEDTDLSYLERKRLEDEFRKLKELKLKAEKYAIEAKQTTQRLSAENSKLREDLSRERKHNEMTRSNIIRELEERSSRDALTGEKMAIRAEVYDREVKGKAYQLAHASPQMQVGQRKGE